MSEIAEKQSESGTFKFQEDIEWPDGDIRETLNKRPESTWKLPVEVCVRPDKAEYAVFLYGMLTHTHKTKDGWVYDIAFEDDDNTKKVRCKGSRIASLKLENELRKDLNSGWDQTALKRADMKSKSPRSRERVQERKRERNLSKIEDPEASAYFASLPLKKEPDSSSATDPQLGFDLVREVNIAYLEGYPLRKPSYASNPPKSAFEVAVEKSSWNNPSTVENQYYRWIKALNFMD